MTIKFITITSSRLFRDSLSSCSPIEWAECSEFVDTTLKQGCTNNAFYVAQDFYMRFPPTMNISFFFEKKRTEKRF